MARHVQEQAGIPADLGVFVDADPDHFTAGRVCALADKRHPLLELGILSGFRNRFVRVPKDRVVPSDPLGAEACRARIRPVLLAQKSASLSTFNLCPNPKPSIFAPAAAARTCWRTRGRRPERSMAQA